MCVAGAAGLASDMAPRAALTGTANTANAPTAGSAPVPATVYEPTEQDIQVEAKWQRAKRLAQLTQSRLDGARGGHALGPQPLHVNMVAQRGGATAAVEKST